MKKKQNEQQHGKTYGKTHMKENTPCQMAINKRWDVCFLVDLLWLESRREIKAFVSFCIMNHYHYPPWKLTWHWNITMFTRRYIFKWWVFHCHVSFAGVYLFKQKSVGNCRSTPGTPLKMKGGNLKITQSKRNIIFQTSIFRVPAHNFPGCIGNSTQTSIVGTFASGQTVTLIQKFT